MVMDIWGWIVVYAIALTVLQLLVYRYLSNRGGGTLADGSGMFGRDSDAERLDYADRSLVNDSSSTGPQTDRRSELGTHPEPGNRYGAPVRQDGPDADVEGRRCPHCAAVNEPDTTFSLCWNCTQRLE